MEQPNLSQPNPVSDRINNPADRCPPGVVDVLFRVDVNLDARVIDESGVGERLHVGDEEVGDPELSLRRAHLEVGLPRLQLVLECRLINVLREDLKD